MKTQLYFAYGSNLDLAQMHMRCPRAVPVARARAYRWRLAFRWFADIVNDPSEFAEGAVYRVTPECEAALDRYEGVARGSYYREHIDVTLANGKVVRALVYLMRPRRFSSPPLHYLATIKRGFKAWGIDPAPLNAAVRRAYLADKDNFEDTRRAWESYATKHPPAKREPQQATFALAAPVSPMRQPAKKITHKNARKKQPMVEERDVGDLLADHLASLDADEFFSDLVPYGKRVKDE